MTGPRPDSVDVIDLLRALGFTPRETPLPGQPAAVVERGPVQVIYEEGRVEIYARGAAPARLPLWSAAFAPTTPLMAIVAVLAIATDTAG